MLSIRCHSAYKDLQLKTDVISSIESDISESYTQ